MAQTDDSSFHIVIIGDTGVGKSSLFLRIFDDRNFKLNSRPRFPLIEGYGATYLNFNGKRNCLKVRDSAGQEYLSRTVLMYQFFYPVNGIMLTYDITKRESFRNIASWLETAKGWASPTSEYLLLGNCCDLEEERQVSFEEGREFAEKHSLMFFEVSAKTGENGSSAMKKLAKRMVDSRQRQEEEKVRKAKIEKEKIALQKRSQVNKIWSLREIFSDFIFFLSVLLEALLHPLDSITTFCK